MEPTTQMRVSIDDIPTSTTITLTPTFVGEAIATLPMRAALERGVDDPQAGGGEVTLDLHADGTSVFATGRIHGWLEVACSRCLGPARIPFEEALRVTYVPEAEVPKDPVDAEEELTIAPGDEELDVYGYDGETVDLAPLLREQVVLAVPYAPLCKEDCAGLCPQCGADKNLSPCSCEPPIDPRFAALKSLKV